MDFLLRPDESSTSAFRLTRRIIVERPPSSIAWADIGHVLAIGTGSEIRVIHTLTGKQTRSFTDRSSVIALRWSSDGNFLASINEDREVSIWNTDPTLKHVARRTFPEAAACIAWHRTEPLLAVAYDNGTVRIWDASLDIPKKIYRPRAVGITSLAWSPDAKFLAAGTVTGDVTIWHRSTGAPAGVLQGHTRAVSSMVWSHENGTLVTASFDGTVRIWHVEDSRALQIFEGHSPYITEINYLPGRSALLAHSIDRTLRVWLLDRPQEAGVQQGVIANVAVNGRTGEIAAALAEHKEYVGVWEFDPERLDEARDATTSVHYRNAKIVVVGDTGSGKSALSLVLTGSPFVPTESTHGRHVKVLAAEEARSEDGTVENREALLWDLAGQPGYRLVHQLHLNEVEVALIVFDARSDTNPFAGVQHWARALRLAERVGGSGRPVAKFLVAARTDRGGIGVPAPRIEALLQQLQIDRYFETSAKEMWGIDELRAAVRAAIDWNQLPRVTSTQLLQEIREFLIAEKDAGRILTRFPELYKRFTASRPHNGGGDFRQEFDVCIGRVESRGLIKRLSFGDYVLLQPEYVDAYASAIVNHAKDEPDGFGSIAEDLVLSGRFPMPASERIANKTLEKLLLVTTVQDLLHHEIAIREDAGVGRQLVFPSQLTRENPEIPDPGGKSATFTFEGPIQNIYSTLVVRLMHSGTFRKKEMWRNAVTFTTKANEECGLFLRELGEGKGEITVFFGASTEDLSRGRFEEFVHQHLSRRSIPQTLAVKRAIVCPSCREPVTDSQIRKRLEKGHTSMICPVCDTTVPLDEYSEMPETLSSDIEALDRNADARARRETAATVISGKRAAGDFDVFLCHNTEDKESVRSIAERLKQRGVMPWLDEWELRPGFSWQRILEEQISQIRSAAVFIGETGVGPWQRQEIEAFLQEFVNRGVPVIPVLLESAPAKPQLHVPVFLRSFTWVDFRVVEPDPLEKLVWGITGDRPHALV